ncbi:bacterio-opsin activator domain-containing protein [Haloarchaeobius sp. DFWS5]|uniref:bacterio-opsin activator domain-containing protein n=1 Tax=Haloarchaeobius sp. DFWS5 TaxID=3446114 RepID=UPI003EB898D8
MAPNLAPEGVLVVGDANALPPLENSSQTRSVETTAAAQAELQRVPPACLVLVGVPDDETFVSFLRSVDTREIGVVACPADDVAAETVSDLVAAGVDEYVPLSVAEAASRVAEAVDRCVEVGRTRQRRRRRATLFEALFTDEHAPAWVLDATGTVVRANDAALALVDESPEELYNTSFGATQWWDDAERERVEAAVATASDGVPASFEVTVPSVAGDSTAERTLDVHVRPTGERDQSLVVQTTDVTERARIVDDLQASEELHRVTLNNMTDTVLMTDDDGRFTYVCPNVHFIFGYSAAEIHELGTIDELLGDDLFDPDELDANGVLTNIECTATDSGGELHTLLVNVRKVSIQGGTTLFSCRDITKRKRREEALAALHSTSRNLLYAETASEIGKHVVDDGVSVLDMDATATYLFDRDGDEFRAVASSPTMRRLSGPLPALQPGETSLVGETFVDGDPQFFPDVHDADALSNPVTGLRSATFVPLGDHGVFVAGSDERTEFDAVSRELADLLGATAEAALDRVAREQALREQERERKRQNTRLTRLDRLNTVIRDIDRVLVRAETQREIAHTVCERLTDTDRFRFAWIGRPTTAGDALEPYAWSGTGHGYLDATSFDLTAAEPATRTAEARSATVVESVVDGLHDEQWRKAALSREFQSVISVPLAYDEVSYGVLTVYADRSAAFGETDRTVFTELGETIASAMSAVERKSALLTQGGTSLELDVVDEDFVLTRIARETDCRLRFRGGVQQMDDGIAVFVSVDGTDPTTVATVAAQLVEVRGATAIGESGDARLLRLELARPFVALTLADHGAVLQEVSTDGASASLTVDVPDGVDTRSVERLVAKEFASVELHSKQTHEPVEPRGLYATLFDRLTDRQLEVLQTAYYSGFFESPRESSGEAVASALDISSTAFYNHVRRVERKLFSTLFDEVGVSPSTGD